jgi:hypothetical protein
MSALTYQMILARAVVDDVFWRHFKQDRPQLLETLALDDAEKASLLRLDNQAVDIFREVVQGSRVRQFSLFFRRLHVLVGNADWTALVNRFQSEITIRDSSRHKDAELFCTWLEQEFPSSVASEVAAYELRLLRMDAPQSIESSSLSFSKHPLVETLAITRQFEELSDVAAESLWVCSTDATFRYYILKGDRASRDVEIIEGTALTHRCLEVLRTARTRAELSVRFSVGSDLDQILHELTSAGLVTEDAR